MKKKETVKVPVKVKRTRVEKRYVCPYQCCFTLALERYIIYLFICIQRSFYLVIVFKAIFFPYQLSVSYLLSVNESIKVLD